MALDLSSLQKAVDSLERAVKVASVQIKGDIETDHEEVIRAGVIQNFEFTYELCWKFMQRWLKENRGAEAADLAKTRKELFRMAAQHGLIEDPIPWFQYGEARNLTAHTYNNDQAQIVFQEAIRFVSAAQHLLKQIEMRND